MGRSFAEELQAAGRREGLRKGRREEAVKARQQTLLRQLRHRFGNVPEVIAGAVNGCRDVQQLDAWLDNFATARALADVGIGGAS